MRIRAVDSGVAGYRTASLWCNTEFEMMARAINLDAQESHMLRGIAKAVMIGSRVMMLWFFMIYLLFFLPCNVCDGMVNHQVLLLGIEAILPN